MNIKILYYIHVAVVLAVFWKFLYLICFPGATYHTHHNCTSRIESIIHYDYLRFFTKLESPIPSQLALNVFVCGPGLSSTGLQFREVLVDCLLDPIYGELAP